MKTKKILWTISLLAFFMAILSSPAIGADKQIIVRYSHQHPTTFSFHKGAEKFAEVVEAKSKGRVKFELYPASQLYRASETVKAVTSGDVEMGHCVIDEWGLVFPLANIFMQPFMVTSKEARRELTRGKSGAAIEQQMIKAGARPLFWMPHDSLSVFFNNKRPLKVPKDFEGLLIRTTPGTQAMVQALGAKAVRMNVNDVYMALKRGTVDGTWTAPSSGTNRKWYEVAEYSTIIEVLTIYNVAFINEKFWNKLPEDIQQIMRNAANEAHELVEGIALHEQEKAVKILKEKTQVYFPTQQEIMLWKDATKPVINNYIKNGNDSVSLAIKQIERMK